MADRRRRVATLLAGVLVLALLVSRGRCGPGPERARHPALADLPLVEVPVQAGSSALLAVVVSGDGGWAALDRQVAGVLAARGVPVVGLDSLRYFWAARSPDEAGRALERILRFYLPRWRRSGAVLVGYSRGADVLPFMASRLPADLRERVALVALLGPGREIDFEFHVTEWLLAPRGPDLLAVGPEVEKLRGIPVLCIHGESEADSLCPSLPSDLATSVARPGGHHFGGDYPALARRILEAVRRPIPARRG